MLNDKKNLKRVLLMIDKYHHQELKNIAEKENTAMSFLVRKALTNYIRNYYKQAKKNN